MLDREFKFGRIAIVISVLLGLTPYLFLYSLIAYIFGIILIILSKQEQTKKIIWILSPIFIIGLIYLYYTSR